MIILVKLASLIINSMLKLKGASIGKGTIIGPGFDWINVRWKGVTIGARCIIGRRAWIDLQKNDSGQRIFIGDETTIGRGCVISCVKSITIGSGCVLSYNVSILDHEHKFKLGVSPRYTGVTEGNAVIIGNNVFIGAHSFILKGVTLGNDCVVGANSVVTHSFPAGSLVCGSPARQIGNMTCTPPAVIA